jgi:hypothetical protein
MDGTTQLVLHMTGIGCLCSFWVGRFCSTENYTSRDVHRCPQAPFCDPVCKRRLCRVTAALNTTDLYVAFGDSTIVIPFNVFKDLFKLNGDGLLGLEEIATYIIGVDKHEAKSNLHAATIYKLPTEGGFWLSMIYFTRGLCLLPGAYVPNETANSNLFMVEALCYLIGASYDEFWFLKNLSLNFALVEASKLKFKTSIIQDFKACSECDAFYQ